MKILGSLLKSILLISFFQIYVLQVKLLAENQAPSKLEIKKYQICKANLKHEKNFFALASGLSFYKANSYGKIRFYSVVDQFTNLPAQEKAPPHVAIFKLGKKDFQIERYLPIVSNDPRIDLNALDIEAVSTAPAEKLWLVDELTNSLIEVDSNNGKIQLLLQLGEELPEIFTKMQERRGFEGLCYLPQAALLATLQSPLSEPFSKIGGNNFIPFLFYDLRSKSAKIFVYEILSEIFDNPTEVKIGDIQAVSEHLALIIIRGIKNDKQVRRVELISLAQASDVSQQLKLGVTAELLNTIKYTPITVQKYLDLAETSYRSEKIEGLTIYDNGKSIALINDADGDLNNLELMTIELEEPLITWGIFEWTILAVLSIFFLLSLYFMLVVLLK